MATNTNENNTIIKTGNTSFDAGVRLGVKIGCNRGIKDYFEDNRYNQFTQEELQFLKSTFSGILTRLHDYQERINLKISELFEKCNPEDPNTSGAFVVMNGLRDDLREKKVITKRLASIQKKIKSSLRRG
jgi:hypothetical protein